MTDRLAQEVERDPMADDEPCPWAQQAARTLRAEMARRGIKARDVVALLAAKGHAISVQSFHSKLSRGTFSAGFFLRTLDAIGCQWELKAAQDSHK